MQTALTPTSLQITRPAFDLLLCVSDPLRREDIDGSILDWILWIKNTNTSFFFLRLRKPQKLGSGDTVVRIDFHTLGVSELLGFFKLCLINFFFKNGTCATNPAKANLGTVVD